MVAYARMPFQSEQIGQRLHDARERAGMSANALAKAAGLTHTTVQDIEMGRRNPGVETMERLAQALGVDPCWLAYGTGTKRPDSTA